MNQTVVDTRKANNHVVFGPIGFAGVGAAFGAAAAGVARLFQPVWLSELSRLHGLFYCQRNQFIKAWVIITGH